MFVSSIGHHLLWSLWFLGPAGAGNVAPLVAAHLPMLKRLDMPVDGGHVWRGHRILGDHKTWRGIIAGIIFGTVAGCLQLLIARAAGHPLGFIPSNSFDFTSTATVGLGALLGFGAVFGDSLKSFAKRQVDVTPGKSWPPFDQVDYVIGAYLVALPLVRLRWLDYLIGLMVWVGIQVGASYFGYLIKWRASRFS